MTMNRAGMMQAAALLATPAVARAQDVNGSCRPVFDAMLKETSTPHHMVTFRAATGLPIRSDVSLQANQKTSITTRYDYAHITAPVVK